MGASNLYIRIFGRPAFEGFNKLLIRYGMKGLGIKNFTSDYGSGETFYFRRFANEIDRPGNAILDVGAHDGSFTALALSCTRHLVVHAFEPGPQSFARLQQRFAGEPRVRLHNVAAGASRSTAQLFDYRGKEGTERATLVAGVLADERAEARPVEVVPLDEIDGLNEHAIVFAKIDVEGFEMNVLKGMKALLAKPHLKRIVLEFNSMNREARVFLMDIVNTLLDFAPNRILPGGRVLRLDPRDAMFTEIFAYQNLAFERLSRA